jgi:hypothetical protein
MFRNSNNNSDTEDRHMRSGRVFREVHLTNLFKQNYEDEGFYSGEEAYLMDEEHSEPTRVEEEEAEDLRQENPETSGTAQTIEVSTINTPVGSTTLRNQSNQSYQTVHNTITSSPPHTQT